jgi:hypothetical protein
MNGVKGYLKDQASRLLGVGAMILLLAGLAQAQTIHVSTAGNDTTGDGSAGAPYATVTKALTEAATALPDPVPAPNATAETLLANAIAYVTQGQAGTQAALVVSDPVSPKPEDVWLNERITAAGFTVELVDDGNAGGTFGLAQANAKNLVVFAASIGSGSIDGLRTMSAPVINMETWSWDNWGYTDGADANGDNETSQTQITIAGTASSALVGSLTGNVTVYEHAWTVNADSGAIIDPDIVVDAHVVGNTSQVCLWHAEAGTLVNSTGRTVGFFISEDAGFGQLPASASVTVRVAEGTYAENDLALPPATLEGGWNAGFTANSGTAANTIIDGTNSGKILGLLGGDATLRYITLKDANATASGSDGGALYHAVGGAGIATLVIDQCIFEGNEGAGASPGQYGVINLNDIATLVDIRETAFTNNGGDTAANESPVRINTDVDAEVRFTTCTFTGNVFERRLLDNDGGGNTTFIGCSFSNNQAGGSSFLRTRRLDGTFRISNCTFDQNAAGGGRFFEVDDVRSAAGSLLVENCVFTSNTMGTIISMVYDDDGGGITDNFSVRVVNNVFAGTVTGSIGMPLQGVNFVIANNTFFGGVGGGDILLQVANTPALVGVQAIAVNNIFMENDNYDEGIFGTDLGGNVWSSVRANIFHDNADAGTGPAPGTTDGTTAIAIESGPGVGLGNFDADPLFINPSVAARNYDIPSNSPAVDAGESVGGVTTDIEGKVRPQGSGFDIGAYEFAAGVINAVNDWILF